MRFGFIDIEKLKAEGWKLTRTVAFDGEFKREFMPLDDIPPVDAFRALVDYAASLGQKVEITFSDLQEEI